MEYSLILLACIPYLSNILQFLQTTRGSLFAILFSPLSQLKSKFPTVTYHPSLTEHDNDWQPNTRETRQDVSRRIHTFFRWLLQQPHNNIAIVTHGVWAECALLNYCPKVLQHGEKRVYNCDVYQGILAGSLGDKNESDFSLTDVTQMSLYPV